MLVKQLKLDLNTPRKWGGRQPGAGRPRGPRPVVYGKRHEVSKHEPLHVTMRVVEDVPVLRKRRFVNAFRCTLAECCARNGFRVVHYSIQKNHVHCLVEADGKEALANGMKSFASRVGRTINRVFERKGRALDRFHSRSLRTPKEVRHALAYVLLNVRKHWMQTHATPPPARIDHASSGVWFDGWKYFKPKPPVIEPEVAVAESWLLRTGWRKHRLIDVAEVPAC